MIALRPYLRWIAIGVLNLASLGQSADFYVAPGGADTWSGKLSEPNAERSDGPFATLERARDAVRERTAKDTVVQIREGSYGLSEAVVFGVEDSGEGHATITYEA